MKLAASATWQNSSGAQRFKAIRQVPSSDGGDVHKPVSETSKAEEDVDVTTQETVRARTQTCIHTTIILCF